MKVKIRALEYHLTDHCNLNCAGCTHFSPLAKERYASLERFEDNLIQLKKWNFEIQQFNLLGGEPLLHPQVREFILVAKKHLKCVITLKTNGILLDKEFIQFCDDNFIQIVHTDYGYSEIKNRHNEVSKFMCHFISEEPMYNTKCGDISFKGEYSYACSQLEENGDLHFCGYSANVKHYNEYYNVNIPVKRDEDFFNIYDTSLREIDIWKKYIIRRPFCNHCVSPTMKEWHLFNGADEWKKT